MSRARRQRPRRAWTVLKLLLVVAVLAGGATAIYPMWRAANPEPTELTVRYKTDGSATDTVAKPWLEVTNTSDKTVPLSDVTLRYYFAADDGATYGSNCVQTYVGCTNVTAKIGALTDPASTASHYLQIGFSSAAGSLKPGETTQGIGLQLYRLDHKALNQADDHSFNGEHTHYTESKLVPAYLRGTRVWGDEPGEGTTAQGQGAPSAAAGSVPARAVSAPPAGVLFDNFHYTGPNDPALAANGWEVRTGEGGPGIKDTWAPSHISFPSTADTKGGQALQLRLTTDGTKQGTKQSELLTTKPDFSTGTLAARVHFSDKPTDGRDGDHINESFFAISPDHRSTKYSELDFEYMPNGGWGAVGPRLDTTSWRSSTQGDRVTRSLENKSLKGWHTMMISAVDGKVVYSMDGRELFSHGSEHFPREHMSIHFSAWLVDLPFKGDRTWDMRVDWTYYQAGQKVSLEDVEKAVDGFHADGTNYVNTLPKS
ncbi:cellulose binding domain-containing protein [Streptomyces sp. NPDC003027]